MEILLTNMVPIILVIKIFILCTTLGVLAISFFHRQESLNMENRLGIIVPQRIKLFASLHVIAALTILIAFSIISFL